MGRNKKARELDVLLNGIKVGVLVKDSSGRISYQYDKDWLDQGHAISQSLPMQEEEYRGAVVSSYFDNLLPDNDGLKRKIAEKFGAQSTRSFDLLEVIGRDCVGALSFIPRGEEKENFLEMKYSPLSDSAIAKKLSGLSDIGPLGMEGHDFRISIAGAQEKTALLKIRNKWYLPHGLTPTTHILKRPIRARGENLNFDDSVDNEWACITIMKKMGLSVCPVEISVFGSHRVLVVERFDRIWRNHNKILLRKTQEDMCQALGVSPYQKYQVDGGPGIQEINNLLRASTQEKDRYNFFKAILIFDLLCATDGHAKNFSIFLNSDGFKLTPFYDVMSAYFLSAKKKYSVQKLKLAMKVGNNGHYNFKRIFMRHYEQTAKKCGFSKDDFDKLVSEVKESYEKLDFKKKELDPKLNTETLSMILERMKSRAKTLF